MASGKLIPPTTFTAHANKIRAKYLEKLALRVRQGPSERAGRPEPVPSGNALRRVIYPIRSGLRRP